MPPFGAAIRDFLLGLGFAYRVVKEKQAAWAGAIEDLTDFSRDSREKARTQTGEYIIRDGQSP